MSSGANWERVRRDQPCPICNHPDWCMVAADGSAALCARIEQGASAKTGGGWVHRLIEPVNGRQDNGRPRRDTQRNPRPAAERDWLAEAERRREEMTDAHLQALADATSIPASAWALLSPGRADAENLRRLRAGGAGWQEAPPDSAWTFAEHSGDGRVVGLALRAADGRKGAPAGAKRGLIVPANLHQLPDPVLIVEGASDVAACCALGLAAVGRPSNRGGADDLAVMLDGRDVLVVGERDGKPSGAWPGRDGAKAVAQHLAARWNQTVSWALPPPAAKDIRDWLRVRLDGGLNPADADGMRNAGGELLEALSAAAKPAKPERRTQADALVDLAKSDYRLGISADGEAFAVSVEGPAVAMMFRGGGSGLRAALAKAYRQRTGKTPSASALADALLALEGMAQDAAPEPLGLRVAEHGGGVVLDLGDATGRAVVVTPGGWAVQAVSPVLFRRTALTAAMPEPQSAEPADLLELRELLNVDDDTWPLMAGWMVAALMPGIPHPVLMLGGEQGTGKTSAARLILGLMDPSCAPLRSEPRDAEQWAIAAAGSWGVCLDNVSHISGWLSDAICKAVTGDGLVRRKLYTDSDLAVLAFRRCIILTSIDHGALRGDLGDRLLLADLERIADDERRTEAELDVAYRAIRPRLLGALLGAVSRTLEALPDVKLATMPRMADFARVLAALDTACPALTGGKALALFDGQRRRIAGEVVESDSVALALTQLLESHSEWEGTAGELLTALTPATTPKGWPANARALSGRLRRVRPALLGVGIVYSPPAPADKTRTHRIERAGNRPPEPPEPPTSGDSEQPIGFSDGPDVGGTAPATARLPGDRPTESAVLDAVGAGVGGVGGMGGTTLHTSEADDAGWGEV